METRSVWMEEEVLMGEMAKKNACYEEVNLKKSLEWHLAKEMVTK